jgi:hypothetical protein
VDERKKRGKRMSENIWYGMDKESVPATSVNPSDVEKTMQKYDKHYHGPVKMRFEWDGRIYEGTAYYLRDAKEQE